MKINIIDVDKDQSASLLKKILDLLLEENQKMQGKITNLEMDEQSAKSQIANFLSGANKKFEERALTLDDVITRIDSLNSAEQAKDKEINSFIDAFNKKFDEIAVSPEYKEKASSLEDVIIRITSLISAEQANVEQIEKFIKDINGKFDETASSLEDVKNKVYSLDEVFKQDLMNSKLYTLKTLLNDSLNSIKESSVEKWKDFISEIVSGMEKTLKSTDPVGERLFQIQKKNGWLTKLVSLYWWSRESHIKDFVPACYSEDSIINIFFEDFIKYLETQELKINIPPNDFSGELSNYESDYDGESKWIKELFPQYNLTDFVLCEISFLSINTGKGKCLGYKQ